MTSPLLFHGALVCLANFRSFEETKNQAREHANATAVTTNVPPVPSATADVEATLSFARVPSLDILSVEPYFRYGPIYATCLLQYLQALQWPTNDAAKEVVPTITVAELMLDMYFSTGIASPKLVQSNTGMKDFIYQLDPKGQSACPSF